MQTAKPGLVIFNAGGPGSGKSSSLTASAKARAAIVYDTVMADPKRAVEQINQALDAGHHVAINYIHQPLEAAVRNTIDRAARVDNGRVVEAYATARAHKNAQEAIFKVSHHFASDPRVKINVIDNTDFKARPSSLQELQTVQYNDDLARLITRATVEAKRHLHERTTQNPAFNEALAKRVLRSPGRMGDGGDARTHAPGERGLPNRQTTPRRAASEARPRALSALVKNTRLVARQAAEMVEARLPGILTPKLSFFTNPEELLASNYAAENTFTQREIEQMRQAEGFHDTARLGARFWESSAAGGIADSRLLSELLCRSTSLRRRRGHPPELPGASRAGSGPSLCG